MEGYAVFGARGQYRFGTPPLSASLKIHTNQPLKLEPYEMANIKLAKLTGQRYVTTMYVGPPLDDTAQKKGPHPLPPRLFQALGTKIWQESWNSLISSCNWMNSWLGECSVDTDWAAMEIFYSMTLAQAKAYQVRSVLSTEIFFCSALCSPSLH
jgi:hypothetical protein